ncbi:hypothetical protein [Actinomadura rifamycini]|uniref:hypothetical protein n=1 Tax=Actinomadura rifamycini TaxID=31962 RepID=UPI0003FA685E|nr:hypothetical protein [Actinomadura rifamycini]
MTPGGPPPDGPPDGGSGGPPPAPGRVLVTGSRARAARRPRYPVTREIDEQTGLGEAYMRSLVRAQFRLAARLCAVLAIVVFGLPGLFALVPQAREQQVLGLPLPWVVLAGAIYPCFVVLGRLYVRLAERNEDDFAELVDRDPAARDPLATDPTGTPRPSGPSGPSGPPAPPA